MNLRSFAKNLMPSAVATSLVLLISSGAFAGKAKPIHKGEVLSGELTAMRSKRTKTITFQLTSEPRRLPAPSGLCNLETGPETFQIVASNAAETKALKALIGKTVALKANELSCAMEAGQYSDAVVTQWSVVQ